MPSRRVRATLHKGLCGLTALSVLMSGIVPASAAGRRVPKPRQAHAEYAPSQVSDRSQTESISKAAAAGHDQTETAKIKLNWLNASWSKVLQDLAEESGSTLVMDKTPRGNFSRMDRTKYSRAEAVRVLNRELEPKGFRIVEKEQFLVVLALDDVRSQYRRPVVRDHGTSDQANEPDSSRQSKHKLQPASHSTESEAAHEETVETFEVTRQARRDQRSDRPRSVGARNQNADDEAGVRFASADEAEDLDREENPTHGGPSLPPAPKSIEPNPLETKSARQHPIGRNELAVVDIRHGNAADVARIVYGGLKSRSELVDSGPEGLPSFRTFRSENKAAQSARKELLGEKRSSQDVLFTVGINADQGQLLINAPAQLANQLARLFREIDAVQGDHATAIRVMSGDDNTIRISQNLGPELARFVARKEQLDTTAGHRGPDRRTRGQARNDFDDGSDLLAQNDPGNPQPEQPQPQQPNLQDLLGGLGGNVAVESMPDSGVLILRGNPKDVESVMKVIREIEKLSVGAAPEIHIHPLKHVNSESLALLMNSVYEKLSSMRNRDTQPRQLVYFISVVKPNSVLILAPPADMKAILQLVDELDQPVDPETEFQVFALKSASAAHVAATLNDFYRERTTGGQEQEQGSVAGTGLRTRVSAYPDFRTNSVIVQARPRDLAEIAALVRKIDRDESGSVSKMRIFRLKNSVALELADVINAALQSILNPTAGGFRGGSTPNLGSNAGPTTGPSTGPQARGTSPNSASASTGQSSQQLQDAKSVVLEFLAPDGNADGIVRSGLLTDVRVTADPRINSLVVTAPEQSMQLMAELIRHLDQPAALVAEIKVYTLKNGDANQMAELLRAMFGGGTGQNQSQQGNIQLAGAEDPGSLLVPVRFSVDARTNSVIAVAGSDAQVAIEALIARLDAGDVRQRQNLVIKLKNSYAPDVAQAINDFLQSQRELAQLDPDLVSSVEFLEREIIAVPEQASNSLLISATPRYFEEIKKIVAKLDEPPPQVIIQALLVEVELQNTDEFGVELGFQDSVLFDRSIINNIQTIQQTVSNPGTGIATTTQKIISQEATPGFAFNNAPLGTNPAVNSSSVGKQSLSNFGLGRTNNDLGYGGLVLSAGSESVSVLLRALSAQRKINILSRPQIRTLDNQEATIQVGQRVPIVNGFLPGVNGSVGSPSIQQDDAGIILSVRPRISPDGTIVMQTIAQKSQYAPGNTVPIFTDINTGSVVTSPIKDVTIANSVVSVPNGQTIVMGGMITKSDSNTQRKVPWLGDLPLIGRGFRFDSTSSRRTELLIFLTPRIISSGEDNEIIKQVEAERIHFIVEEAEAIHGPIFGVSPADGSDPLKLPQLHEGAAPALPPAPGEMPGSAEDDGIPTTIMPSSALRVDEPKFPDAGTTTVSDDGELSNATRYQTGASSAETNASRTERGSRKAVKPRLLNESLP